MHEVVQGVPTTPPWNSNLARTREGTSKHTTCMIDADIRGKRELGEDVRKHGIDRAPNDINET